TTVSFNRDVRPILASQCFQCHGPDAVHRKGDLRLDLADGPFKRDFPAIVPGKPSESLLIQRILSTDESEMMPPPDSKKTLTQRQKEILKTWVAEGGQYAKHWSFEPIQDSLPPSDSKDVHLIDAFLDAAVAKTQFKAQPEADRATLIRRVSFTLTGLPPTIAEIDQYLSDDQPGAYERMIDRYFQSPRYGEEMAKHWLDVARYADTHGLHLDNERQMWAYRDWVVKAFNDNLPFDQFTIWQVAGDLLPEPTTDQLVATGFNRCNVTTSEGGAIVDEYLYRYAVERTTTVAQVWLGLTAGCAVCHDHKYDPITMNEFYSLYAFFNNAADPALDGNTNVTSPFLKLPDTKMKATAQTAAEVERDARKWLDTISESTKYIDPSADSTSTNRRSIREVLFDDVVPIGSSVRSSSRNPIDWILDPSCEAHSGRRVIRQEFASSSYDQIEFKLRPLVVPEDAVLEIAVRIDSKETPTSIAFGPLNGKNVTWKRAEKGKEFIREGSTESPIPLDTWTILRISSTDFELKPNDPITGIKVSQTGGIVYWDAAILSGKSNPSVDPLESLAQWRKRLGTTVPPELPSELNSVIQAGPDKVLTEEETSKLTNFYVGLIGRPINREMEQARTAWDAARV
ncbi:MAG: DUF1549 domain-containing protein, partial [Planctomycetes bacterium]|nr:DUF1549 domain-containing protein [Planctomycetota bacterium]